MTFKTLAFSGLLALTSSLAFAGDYYFVDSSFCSSTDVVVNDSVKMLALPDDGTIAFNFDLLQGLPEDGRQFLSDLMESQESKLIKGALTQQYGQGGINGITDVAVYQSESQTFTIADFGKKAGALIYSDESYVYVMELMKKLGKKYGLNPDDSVKIGLGIGLAISEDKKKIVLTDVDLIFYPVAEDKILGTLHYIDAVNPTLEEVAGTKVSPDHRCGVLK